MILFLKKVNLKKSKKLINKNFLIYKHQKQK